MERHSQNSLVEYGLITHVGDKAIEVLCQSKVDCKRCAEGKGCGGGILARWLGERQHTLSIPCSSELSPQVGHVAKFALPSSLIVRISALTYGLPLLFVAIALIVLNFLNMPEIMNTIIGLCALGLGVYISRCLIRRDIFSGRYVPTLLSVNCKQDEVSCDIESIQRRQG